MTGILPIKREQTQSALNNFTEYTIIDAGPFAGYIGFTEEEVRNLSGKYNVDYEEVRRWYDGYLLDGLHIYNPRAVVSVMLSGKFKSYWSNTSSYKAVVPLINMNFANLKDSVFELLSGNEVDVDTTGFQNDMVSFTSKDDVLTLLIHLGYLTYNETTKTCHIPNEEIRGEMNSAVEKADWKERATLMKESENILFATLRRDEKTVAEGMEIFHDRFTSSLKYSDENSLSHIFQPSIITSILYVSSRQARDLQTSYIFQSRKD